MKSILITLLFIAFFAFTSEQLLAQKEAQNVLFLGNSYTFYNTLPKLLSDVAESAGDSVVYDSSTPGGYTLAQHSTNSTSLGKIMRYDFKNLKIIFLSLFYKME